MARHNHAHAAARIKIFGRTVRVHSKLAVTAVSQHHADATPPQISAACAAAPLAIAALHSLRLEARRRTKKLLAHLLHSASLPSAPEWPVFARGHRRRAIHPGRAPKMLRPGVEVPFFGSLTRGRDARGIKEAQHRISQHRTLYFNIIQRRTEHVRLGRQLDPNLFTKHSRLSSPGNTDLHLAPAFGNQRNIQGRALQYDCCTMWN